MRRRGGGGVVSNDSEGVFGNDWMRVICGKRRGSWILAAVIL